jgi:hypothetical protein
MKWYENQLLLAMAWAWVSVLASAMIYVAIR